MNGSVSHDFIHVTLCFSLSGFFFPAGSMDKIRHESNSGHSHSHGGPESAAVGHAQRTQYLEAAHLARSAQRLGKLHVPSQHGPDAASGGWTFVLELFFLDRCLSTFSSIGW